jgi:hypothetical protein
MSFNFIDVFNLNINEFNKQLMEGSNIGIRTQFYNKLNAIPVVVKDFETINNEISYTSNVTIFNARDIYLNILRKYKSWNLNVYSTTEPQNRNLNTNWNDLTNTLINFLDERKKQIQRIYEDYFINFSPIENTSVFNKETTTYSGNEKTTTTNTGSKTNTRTETGKENNTNIKSGSLTDNLDISGTERDTDTHSVSADNFNSLLTDTQDVNTKQFDARRDNRTETYNNVTDSNTKTFENRKSEDVESFNNYKSEQNKDFTNRKNEIELERHGNIGVTTSIKLLNDDINFRLQHNILNTVVDMFIAEYGYLI